MKNIFKISALPFVLCITLPARADLIARDDTGQVLHLPSVQRIVSLAPHATELLYAAGAGAQMVGVSEHSDYPDAARRLPRVGGATPDLERIAALRPDLIVAWPDGMGTVQLQSLKRLRVPLYLSAPRKLDDIPLALERLSAISNNPNQARDAATTFRRELQQLRTSHTRQSKVRVFYQIWDSPLLTLNGKHIVSDAIASCGGINVFASLPALTPRVGVEDVLQADPEVIISPEQAGIAAPWLAHWKHWPRLKAVQKNHLFSVPADLVNRPGPRFLQGMQHICAALEKAASSAN